MNSATPESADAPYLSLQQWRRPKSVVPTSTPWRAWVSLSFLIISFRVGSTEIDAKDITPSGAPDDVASRGGLSGREATMSESAGGTVRVVREMSATGMLKSVDSRIDEASLDRRSLGELDSSQEGQQDSEERVHAKPRIEDTVRKEGRSTVGLGIRKNGPKGT